MKIQLTLSVAFGTGVLLQNITFGQNNPVSNQNLILNTMMGEQENVVRTSRPIVLQIFKQNMEEIKNAVGELVYGLKPSTAWYCSL